MKKINIKEGDKYGKLTLLKRSVKPPYHHVYWECLCECGRKKKIQQGSLRNGDTKSCGCSRTLTQEQSISKTIRKQWYSIKNGAKKRKLKLEVTQEIILDLLQKQNFKCALSGQDIDKTSASLDRIDSKDGYTMSNIQWVHKDVNRMKNVFDQNYFIDTCKAICEKSKKTVDS